jgi:uncharacterized protein
VGESAPEAGEALVDIANGRLVLSPSDLVGHLHCPHLTALSLAAASGELAKPARDDPELALLVRHGLEHERDYLVQLEGEGLVVEHIDDNQPLAERCVKTRAALEAGTDVVYQAAFFDQTGDTASWVGYADFLTKVPTPSDLGAWSYEPEDTKLARSVRPSAVLQLCAYAEQLTALQGRAPVHVHVVLGSLKKVSLHLADFAAYYRAAKARFEASFSHVSATYPVPVEHCAVCRWLECCDAQRIADDHLSLVPGLTSEQARKLAEHASVHSVAELASFGGDHVTGIGKPTLEKLRRQARLLVSARKLTAPPPYELLLAGEPGIGLGRLPQPSPGDLFFDIEGDPHVGEDGLEYLFGVGYLESTGEFAYRAFWGHDTVEEKAAFEELIDFFMKRLASFPEMHIYHYASYEPTALGKLMGRHATKEQEVDELFRGAVLVDLYRVVRQGVCVGVPSYSLKKIEALYMQARTEGIIDAGSSIVEYERWLEDHDDAILVKLEDYNALDCRSTWLLRNWLEGCRLEYATQHGMSPPRPLPQDSQPSEAVADDVSQAAELKSQLEALAVSARSDDASALVLLGNLLDWYRREEKPEWWRFYDRIFRCDDDDLLEDTETIANLEYEGVVGQAKKSLLHRYLFDPDQPFKIQEGQSVRDPESERRKREEHTSIKGPGALVSLDGVAGMLVLRRGQNSTAPHPRHLIPDGPIDTSDQREALRRLARSVISEGIDGTGPYRAVRDLLLRRPPRMRGGRSGQLCEEDQDPSDAAVGLAPLLEAGCLAIQGPPGSGKTWTAARMTVDLVKRGFSVGVTANSHKVIAHLLDETIKAANGRTISISQKANEDQACSHPWVTRRDRASDVVSDLDGGAKVVAGTAWLFSRPDFDQRLDYLIVEEAGQLSLANVCAVGAAARNIVLVGDPRQLSQPSKGTHPPGAGVSALEHMLGDADTMPPGLGIFIDHTRRLHPEICSFVSEIVYDGRLHALPGRELQAIGGTDALAGSGLRWAAVKHEGNSTSAPEEAAAVQEIVTCLIGRTWTNAKGKYRVLTRDDILIVAPYNAQVAAIGRLLRDGVAVGTVDKFQGQEAPVVIVSLTTSSPDQVPRDMEFLYSRNRLNVAVSRAQALTIIVGSPTLLAVPCHTVEQLRLANGLCRYVEMARSVDSDC